ncbi:MAG: LacI family DNA-binding transcriptional regulator, partial [Puniceicoccales bacterium]
PHFNRAVQDYFSNMLHHLEQLRQRGYRNIGLHLSAGLSKRTHGLLHGAYLFDQTNHNSAPIPVGSDELDTPEELRQWIRKYKMDSLIAEPDIYALFQQSGLQAPQDIGFSLLSWKNYDPETPRECAGYDMKAEEVAAGSISFLVSQIHENKYGLSIRPKSLMVSGEFQNGATIRQRTNHSES